MCHIPCSNIKAFDSANKPISNYFGSGKMALTPQVEQKIPFGNEAFRQGLRMGSEEDSATLSITGMRFDKTVRFNDPFTMVWFSFDLLKLLRNANMVIATTRVGCSMASFVHSFVRGCLHPETAH